MKYNLILAGLLVNALACADIYEVIDANGHKTYTDKPPLDRPGMQPLKTAPQTGNSLDSAGLQQQGDEFFDDLKRQQDALAIAEEEAARQEDEARQAATESIAEAEAVLEDASKVRAGDLLPNKDKGMHYTQEYRDRVRNAEAALKRARAAND